MTLGQQELIGRPVSPTNLSAELPALREPFGLSLRVRSTAGRAGDGTPVAPRLHIHKNHPKRTTAAEDHKGRTDHRASLGSGTIRRPDPSATATLPRTAVGAGADDGDGPRGESTE